MKLIKRFWSKEEDERLHQYVAQHKNDWKHIQEFMPDRTATQCAQRWKKIKPREECRNQKWTREEDEKLQEMIKKFEFKWVKIAEHFPHRNGRQIRERYINHLDPSINKKGWTKREDLKLWKLYQKLGTKWSEMQKEFVGRPENMIKNRFYSYVGPVYGKKIAISERKQKSANPKCEAKEGLNSQQAQHLVGEPKSPSQAGDQKMGVEPKLEQITPLPYMSELSIFPMFSYHQSFKDTLLPFQYQQQPYQQPYQQQFQPQQYQQQFASFNGQFGQLGSLNLMQFLSGPSVPIKME